MGASQNPERYAYLAANMLVENGHPIIPVGLETGMVAGTAILNGTPQEENVDTVTLYLSPKRQPPVYQYIKNLKPKRVIFNPGTENPEFETMLQQEGIVAERACTLVLLRTGQY